MTAANEYDDVHELVDRLTPDQVDEVGAQVLRLAAGRRYIVPWSEARRAAAQPPAVDAERFRDDLDAAIDQDRLLSDGR